MAQITAFGKAVYKWMIDHEHNTDWLCTEISQRTGLYCDRSYLAKVLRGERKAQKIKDAIEQIIAEKEES